MLMLYKTNLLIRRNCSRQGKTSEGNEAVVTYDDLTESSDNEAIGGLLDEHTIAVMYAI